MEQESLISEVKFLQTNRKFLGREFLTWLWFKSASQNHQITVTHYGSFQFYIDDKLIFAGSNSSVKESAFKGGAPAYAEEALSAFFSGKMIQEAKFVLQNKDYQWMFLVNADDLALRSVKLPALGADNVQSQHAQRIKLLHMLFDIFQSLYQDYLKLRMSDTIQEELSLFKAWVQEQTKNQVASSVAPF